MNDNETIKQQRFKQPIEIRTGAGVGVCCKK